MATQHQIFPNSCAATSLLCAAEELGIKTLPSHTGYTMWVNDSTLKVNDQDEGKLCQRRIYQWTSNHPHDPPSNAYNWGYSMPTDIASCADHIGLAAEILVCGTWTKEGLKFGYKAEWNRIQNHPAYQPWKGTRSSYHTLDPDQRELAIIAQWQDLVGPVKMIGAMHVIMVRPDGTVMEPGDGMDLGSYQAAKAHCNMHGTGLSIIVRRKSKKVHWG
jgi:cysteine protease IpaJ